MDKELEHWKSVAVTMTQEVKGKDMVIVALVVVVMIMAFVLFIAVWGWISTKGECTRARSDIYRATQICTKKSDENINAIKGVCGNSRRVHEI